MTNVVTLSREELHAVSVKFRATVETVLNALPRIPDCLEEFPRGCCGRLSSMLGQILNDRLAGQALFVSAELYEDCRETHAWLRCGNIAIDVTGDQFAAGQLFLLMSQTPGSSNGKSKNLWVVQHQPSTKWGGILTLTRYTGPSAV